MQQIKYQEQAHVGARASVVLWEIRQFESDRVYYYFCCWFGWFEGGGVRERRERGEAVESWR